MGRHQRPAPLGHGYQASRDRFVGLPSVGLLAMTTRVSPPRHVHRTWPAARKPPRTGHCRHFSILLDPGFRPPRGGFAPGVTEVESPCETGRCRRLLEAALGPKDGAGPRAVVPVDARGSGRGRRCALRRGWIVQDYGERGPPIHSKGCAPDVGTMSAPALEGARRPQPGKPRGKPQMSLAGQVVDGQVRHGPHSGDERSFVREEARGVVRVGVGGSRAWRRHAQEEEDAGDLLLEE